MKIIINDPSDWNFLDMFWSEGKENVKKIYQADKLDDFRELIEEMYPEGIDMTELNDWVAFKWEDLFESLGMSTEEIESACHGKKKGKKKTVKSSQFNTFSSLFIKNNILVEGEECVIEINQNGKWEFVSLDNTPEGWSTKKQARTFKSEDEARKSALMRRLNNAGYSEEAGNLRIEKR